MTNLDPSGKFAYVAINNTGICAFTIDPNTGKLTKVPGLPFGPGFSPNRLAVDLRDNYLDVSTGADSSVFGYAIDLCSGALTEVAGSPFAAGSSAAGIAVWGSQ